MLYLFIIGLYFFGAFMGYLIGKNSRKDETVVFEYPPQSELSNPSINCTPVGFGRPHIQILEVLQSFDPYECTRKQINHKLGKNKYHAYERQLWQWGYVKRREIGNPFGRGKIHFYTLTSKGKDALINNSKF